ncbi:MAG: polysaccharide pyruvyl transferase family protein [Lachnospiraceae bacterium]|nr:polysaccharide pyruvyl transferase family protein [Lachnospiraceae bacterium]
MRDQLTAGIITYHEPYSYGADLQCLGLQLFLEGLGYKAEIIDYSMGAYQELRRKRPFRSLLQRGIRFFNDPKRFLKVKRNASEITRQALPFQEQLEIRNQKFKEFQDKYYNLSPQRYENYSDLKNNCPVYSAYICGSDQIWNPGFCDMDENYFLGFAPKGRRIAYAPSFGVQELPRVWRREYRKRLNNIDFLSVREKTGAEMIKKLRGGGKNSSSCYGSCVFDFLRSMA